MRSPARRVGPIVLALGLLASGFALPGCEGDSGVVGGVPEGTDMTKDYTPPVPMPGMSPKMQRETGRKAATPAKTP
jgi:hypothetical protein